MEERGQKDEEGPHSRQELRPSSLKRSDFKSILNWRTFQTWVISAVCANVRITSLSFVSTVLRSFVSLIDLTTIVLSSLNLRRLLRTNSLTKYHCVPSKTAHNASHNPRPSYAKTAALAFAFVTATQTRISVTPTPTPANHPRAISPPALSCSL